MTALLTLTHGDARVGIAPATGAAITSFTWRDRVVLRPTPSSIVAAGDVRGHACYPLVPYSNRIGRGRLDFEGRTVQLELNFGDHPHAIHGVGWQRPWQVAAHDAASALLAYDHRPTSGNEPRARGAGDHRAWPWPFRATQWFQLASTGDGGSALRMRMSITNTGSERFPFGLGWHPFFPREATTVVGFAARAAWETDSTVMPTKLVPVSGRLAFDPPRVVGEPNLDHVYAGWGGETRIDYPAQGHRIRILGDSACTFTVVYVPEGRDYMALEPVTQMTDAFNRASRGETDTGTRILDPGASFACTMETAVAPLP